MCWLIGAYGSLGPFRRAGGVAAVAPAVFCAVLGLLAASAKFCGSADRVCRVAAVLGCCNLEGAGPRFLGDGLF
eukprot:10971533-Lingulodinium_polyedra.AAC.1